MNGLLVIVLGVLILYLVISGKLDCIIKAMQACSGPNQADATKTLATVSTPTLDTVLSSNA